MFSPNPNHLQLNLTKFLWYDQEFQQKYEPVPHSSVDDQGNP